MEELRELEVQKVVIGLLLSNEKLFFVMKEGQEKNLRIIGYMTCYVWPLIVKRGTSIRRNTVIRLTTECKTWHLFKM